MCPSPLVYVLIFYQVVIGAPPTSRSEVCSNNPVLGLDSLYQCPDHGPREDDDITSTSISEDLMMAGLVLAGLVTLALLVWVLYSYLSQVQQYIYHDFQYDD